MWEDIEFDADKVPTVKLVLHIAQIILGVVIWCLEIAVFRSDRATINGQNGWMFGVCFLSVPVWVYLIGAPRFMRTRRLAQPHAMLTMDALFTIIWLSAFSAQAAYNTANRCGEGCSLSKAIVGLGVFVTLLFGASTFFSIYTLKYWQRNNVLPGYESAGGRLQNIDPDKAAFSLAPHGEEAYAPVNGNDQDEHPVAHSDYSDPYGAPTNVADPYGRDPYGSVSQVGSNYGAPQENPFRQDNLFDQDTSYGGHGVVGPSYSRPTAEDEYHESVQFPSADYGRSHTVR